MCKLFYHYNDYIYIALVLSCPLRSHLLPDHLIILIIRIISVSQPSYVDKITRGLMRSVPYHLDGTQTPETRVQTSPCVQCNTSGRNHSFLPTTQKHMKLKDHVMHTTPSCKPRLFMYHVILYLNHVSKQIRRCDLKWRLASNYFFYKK